MIKDIINKFIAEALKNKQSITLKALRELKSALSTYETTEPAKQVFGVYSEQVEFKIVKKLIKEHQETMNYHSNSTLIEEEKQQCEVLQHFLPEEASEGAIKSYAHAFIKDYIAKNGNVSMKDMKNILSGIKEKFPEVEGGVVSQVLKMYI